jgi:PilZ domain
MARPEESNEFESIGGDRRFDRRYQLQLELRWKLIRRKKVQDTGAGRTIDLSSGGILFDAARPLPVGLNVELSISWPVLLHNVAPMQLVVSGRIIRTNGVHVAVQVTQHEFRTIGVPADQRQVVATSARTQGQMMNSGFSRLDKVQ